MKPLLIAHRGDTVNYSENTLEAFESAFAYGSGGIEFDIQLHNNALVVVHDYLFDASVDYPTLDHVLSSFAHRGRLEIEVKAFDSAILGLLRENLARYPDGDFTITTSEIPLAPRIKEAFPKIPLGLIMHDFFFQDWMNQALVTRKLVGWGHNSLADRLHLSFSVLERFGQRNLVSDLHGAGFHVHSHIFDSAHQKDDLRLLELWGVDECTFDNVSLLLS